MGTRADFYLGRGRDAVWLGSFAWDGDPATVATRLSLDAGQHIASEADWRESVAAMLKATADATYPEMGWPWPWEDSTTTDYAYAWVHPEAEVMVSCFGSPWVELPVVLATPDDWVDTRTSPAVFPNMKAIQNVRWDEGSGVIVITGNGDAQ